MGPPGSIQDRNHVPEDNGKQLIRGIRQTPRFSTRADLLLLGVSQRMVNKSVDWVSRPPSVLRGFGKVKIDTVPGAVQKGSIQFTRKGKTKETLIAITLRVLQHRCKLVGNYAACPVLSGPSAGLIGSTLVGLWENLENMAFGAQFYVESWGWHIINSCMQVNTVFI